MEELIETKLTPKQERFVQEYLLDLNGSAAAVRAGYSEKSAKQIAGENLTKPYLASRIKARQAELAAVAELSQEWVLSNLKNIVAKSSQAVEVEKWDPVQKKMVMTGEYIYDSRGANTALQLIGKHLGMFTERIDLNGMMVVFRGERELED